MSSNKLHILTFLKNLFSLAAIQGMNYVVPLIALPYIIRKLGFENYGTLIYVQSLVGYFGLLIIYSFSFIAMNKISQFSSDMLMKNKIFNNIFWSKLFLLCISCLLIIVLIPFKILPELNLIIPVYVFFISFFLQFDWFYIAEQKINIFTFFSIIGKSLSLLFLFISVKDAHDISYALIFFAIGNLITGILSLTDILRNRAYDILKPKIQNIKEELVLGFTLFLGSSVGYFYTSDFNMFIIGLIRDKKDLGEFGFAYKIIMALGGILGIIYTILIPLLARVYNENKIKYTILFKKIMLFGFGASLIFSFIIFISSDFIISFISGQVNQNSIWVLKISCIIFPIISIGPIFNQVYILSNTNNYVLYVSSITVLVNLILLITFIAFNLPINEILTFNFIFVMITFSISHLFFIRNIFKKLQI